MFKKSPVILLLWVLCFGVSTVKAQDELADPVVGKNVVYDGVMYSFLSLEDKTVSTVYTTGNNADINGEKCPKLTGDVVIPSKITYKGVDYTVTEIGTFTFMYPSGVDANLTSVTLPETITKIGNNAFSGNVNLTTVNIPATCKSIGSLAFQRCTSMTSITIPEGVEEIGNQCFNNSGIEEIVFPNSLITMGSAALTSMSALKKVKFGSGLKVLPESCLSSNKVLSEIDLGQIEIIGGLSLSSLPALKTLHFPATVKEFGDRALINQSSITSYSVDPASPYLTSVNGVLYSKDKTAIIKYPMALEAKSYAVPEGVTNIEQCAFERAPIKDYSFPASLSKLGNYAFWYNSNLTAVDMSKCNLSLIEDGAFTMCENLKSVKLSNTPIVLKDLVWYSNIALTDVDLGGATSLGDLVFSKCASLENVVIPASVTYLGCSIFSECSAFKSVTIAPESEYFAAVDNVIFSKDMTTIVIYPEVLPATEYTVPASVKRIYFGCFMDCVNLLSVHTGENTEVIEGSAFSRCSGLTTLTFGENFKEIGSGATLSCNNLRTVYMYPTTPPVYLDQNKFPYNMNNKGTLYVPEGTLEAYKAAVPWNSVLDIQEMNTSGVGDIIGENEAPVVTVANGAIIVGNAGDAKVSVYDLRGQEVYCGCSNVINLPGGIYIVKVGKTVVKVSI